MDAFGQSTKLHLTFQVMVFVEKGSQLRLQIDGSASCEGGQGGIGLEANVMFLIQYGDKTIWWFFLKTYFESKRIGRFQCQGTRSWRNLDRC